jgi:coenzyme F420-reducing hydrogenase gamma subunit
MGVCASSGGMFNNYSIVQGVDHIVPVDIYLPGCPPRPEMLLDSILKLHDKIQNMKLGVNRQNEITELEQARLRRLPLVPSLRGSVPGSTGPATTVSASTVSSTTVSASTVSSTTGPNGTGAPGMGHDQ